MSCTFESLKPILAPSCLRIKPGLLKVAIGSPQKHTSVSYLGSSFDIVPSHLTLKLYLNLPFFFLPGSF